MSEADLGRLSLEQAEREIYAHILSRNPEHDFEPKLDRVLEACTLLGDPQRAYKVIHLTGTNGKTSTARMAESLVRAHGLRTGLFTSPHLTSVRERIAIDGEPISQEAFVRLWSEVAPFIRIVDARSADAGGPRMSFFEVLTVLAFAAFADAPVDVAVIEVGMGGVWDATNVADADVAVIGPIALDHERWLGSSLAQIAAEKAGIVKPDCAAIVAEQADVVTETIAPALEQARVVIREGEDLEVVDRAAAVGGQLLTLRTPSATYEGVYVPLLGAHQARNASMALTAVEALLADGGDLRSLAGDTVEAGFAAVTSPGRLEIVRTSPTIVVDAAHNPHGIGALAEAMEESFAFSTLVGVVAVLDDKDADGILAGLESLLDSVVVTRSSSPRAIDPEQLARVAVAHFGEDRVVTAADVPSALDAAVQRAERDDDMGGGVLVVGSITVVADARTLLGVDKPQRHGARS
ncbi:folylpolyglutamate synthase/dihydrofolate synthase family protein [Demequina sp.]|uniref:bifunctional folylpolyglutamate synthase/dihydrofolate synthase n=1 Tax=Demequina sp. TaxID=2050685 RepID=UPI0025C62E6B|nr:folylpolyglutamate synthase/dihydrofolate synthase family protein [Demequina sp.]